MLRTRLALLFTLIIVVSTGGCLGGEMYTVGAGDDDDTPAADAAPVDGDASLGPCVAQVANVPDGHHLPGTACQGCHGPAGTAPRFTLAGTLYHDVGGTSALSGATVTVVDCNDKKVQLTTTQNGNFWTTEPLGFPVRVQASLCPDSVPMLAEVATAGSDCNSASCHTAGARVHLH